MWDLVKLLESFCPLDSEAQVCAVVGSCEISVVGDFKEIIQQVLVIKDLEII